MVFLAEGSQIRLAFALTRQVGGAVVRNRIRRRLRAILANLARQDQVPPGVLLVSARPEALQRRPDELRDDVIHLLAALDARRHRSGAR